MLITGCESTDQDPDDHYRDLSGIDIDERPIYGNSRDDDYGDRDELGDGSTWRATKAFEERRSDQRWHQLMD